MFGWVTQFASWAGFLEIAKFVAQKALLLAVVVTVFFPLLWNLGLSFLETATTWGFDKLAAVTGGSSSVACNLVGVGGWIAAQLKIPEAITLMFSFLMLKVTLRMIGSLVPGLKMVK